MVILEISVSHCGATTLKNICSSICLNKLRAECKGNVTCDSATESNLQWDQTAFFTLCWVHGFVVQAVMGHLERNFTGTPSSRHCDARAVGKMVSSCSSANGLKCFACRLISLLITTDKIFFLAVLQSSAVFTTTPGNCKCRQRFWVDQLTVTYTGLLTLRKSDTWWMKARHTC